MGKKKDTPFNDAFSGLRDLARKEPTRPPAKEPARPAPARELPEDDEGELFRRAVGEVAPLATRAGLAPAKAPPSASELRIRDDEAEALTRLSELVAGEGAFDLADSDEYVEGSVQGFDQGLVRRLRAGEFSLQAHLDLHGMTREEAKPALETFVAAARIKGHRCVLVITGRGLHSRDQIPVLKEGVQRWLSRGRVGRHVLAFTTARPKDGGAGAVYVLLRR